MKQDAVESFSLEPLFESKDTDSELVRLKTLWVAVMTYSIRDVVMWVRLTKCEGLDRIPHAKTIGHIHARSGAQWLNSQSFHPGSFEWVCSLFDWCPDTVRRRVVENFYTEDESFSRIF